MAKEEGKTPLSEASPRKDLCRPRNVMRLLSAKTRQQTRAAVEQAQEIRALTRHAMENARQLVKEAAEMFHHNHVRCVQNAKPTAAHEPRISRTVVDILLIEYRAVDVMLFQEALTELLILCQLTTLTQFNEVEAFVAKGGSAPPAPPPCPQLIIVNTRLQDRAVAETLAVLRCLPGYDRIPVILFSGLSAREGHQLRTAHGLTAFVHKPRQWHAYCDAVAAMVYQWSGLEDGSDRTLVEEDTWAMANSDPEGSGD